MKMVQALVIYFLSAIVGTSFPSHVNFNGQFQCLSLMLVTSAGLMFVKRFSIKVFAFITLLLALGGLWLEKANAEKMTQIWRTLARRQLESAAEIRNRPSSPIGSATDQKLVALRNLPPDAKLDEVFTILGKPGLDVGSATHDYNFPLNDGTTVRVRAKLDDSIISIEHEAPPIKEGDETWRFCSPAATWDMLKGQAGVTIVRDGIPMDAVEEM